MFDSGFLTAKGAKLLRRHSGAGQNLFFLTTENTKNRLCVPGAFVVKNKPLSHEGHKEILNPFRGLRASVAKNKPLRHEGHLTSDYTSRNCGKKRTGINHTDLSPSSKLTLSYI